MRQYFSISKNEQYGFLVTALFLGFMFSFRSWGDVEPDIVKGLVAMLLAGTMSLVAVAAHLFAQKTAGIIMGYNVTWSVEIKALLLSLLICFVSTGYLVAPLYGTITINPITELRFGRRPGFRFYHLGWIAATGSIANLVLALLARISYNFAQSDIISDFAMINMAIAVVMSLPLPAADGLHLFFASRTDYVAYVATVIFFSLLLAAQLSLPWLFVLTALFAICAWVGYWLIEKNIK